MGSTTTRHGREISMRHRTWGSALEIVVWLSAAGVAMLNGIVHVVPVSAGGSLAGGGVVALNVVTMVFLGAAVMVTAGMGELRGRRFVEQPVVRRRLSTPGVTRSECRRLVPTRDRAEAAKIVAAVDAERRRIERDLHDGAQQGFVQAALMLGLAADQLRDSENAAVAALIDSSIETLHAALAELRDLSRGVYPFLLAQEGLTAAVQVLVGRSVVPVVLRSDPLPRLRPELEVTAYFVIAEAVTNALKHAQANQITIDICWSHPRLTVTVTDDGVGLAGAASGSGIPGLRTRVTAVGGTLATHSTPSTGTTVIASFRSDDDPTAAGPHVA